MKPALIRSVDAQGRIILPVEIRRTMGISSGDILEIRPSDQGIYLSKYKANVSGKRQIKKYLNLLYSATGCSMAICNCDEVLVSKGIFLREGTAITKDLSDIICTGKEMQIAEKLPAVESEKVFADTVLPLALPMGPSALILFRSNGAPITEQERICARMISSLINISESLD